MADKFTRTDDSFPSHPGRPFSYPDARTPERNITEEGVMQYIGPHWKLSVSETASTGTVTLILIDVAHTVDPSGPVTFEQDGVSHAPSTGPATGLTSGTFTFTFTKDAKHNILIAPVIHQLNGLPDIRAGTETFDIDDIANVISVTGTVQGATANYQVQFDTDTGTGSTNGEYSVNAGVSWTAFAVASDKTGHFSVTMTTSEQDLLIRGKDAGGVAGPAVASKVPATGNSLFLLMQISDTQAEITWEGYNVELSIDNGTWGAPPTDMDGAESGFQIIVSRDTVHHVYAFRSSVSGVAPYTSNTVIVPALADTVPGGSYGSLTNALYSDVTNQVQFGWSWSGPASAFNVYVSENGNPYALRGTTASGATSYLFTSSYDLTTNHADPTVDIGFFVEAVIGSTLGNRSVSTVATYNHA